MATKRTIESMVRQYNSGKLGLAAVAERLECSAGKARKILTDNGAVIRKRGRPGTGKNDPIVKRMLQLERKGISQEKIAVEVGRSLSTVNRILMRFRES